MRVGLISDVHGNVPALEAVLADMPSVDMIVCAGDVVGYNPWPSDCVEIVREVADITVMGNHDRMVRTPHQYSNPLARAGLEFAAKQLSDDQRSWLANLPRKVTFADEQYLLVHDHPSIRDKYVRPAEFQTLPRYLDDYRGLVLGHTHIQHEETIDNRLLINPGSVGQPRDGDAKAAYGVLDTERDDVELRRVQYDIDRVISKIEDVDLPVKVGTRLLGGS